MRTFRTLSGGLLAVVLLTAPARSEAATAIEYGSIAALISIHVITAAELPGLNEYVEATFSEASGNQSAVVFLVVDSSGTQTATGNAVITPLAAGFAISALGISGGSAQLEGQTTVDDPGHGNTIVVGEFSASVEGGASLALDSSTTLPTDGSNGYLPVTLSQPGRVWSPLPMTLLTVISEPGIESSDLSATVSIPGAGPFESDYVAIAKLTRTGAGDMAIQMTLEPVSATPSVPAVGGLGLVLLMLGVTTAGFSTGRRRTHTPRH